MNAKDAIRLNIDVAQGVTGALLEDLTDADLLVRPASNANHIAWQLGHLIASERSYMTQLGHAMPALPDGFAESHTKETATSDDPRKFYRKDEYLRLLQQLHDATKIALERTPDADLDKPGPERMRAYAPTIGAVFAMVGQHELMHQGQFVTVRRKLGKPILF
jgi:uncharacterized damage-inducible protein DinB